MKEKFWGFLKKTAVLSFFGVWFFVQGMNAKTWMISQWIHALNPDNPNNVAIPFGAIGTFFAIWIWVMIFYWLGYSLQFLINQGLERLEGFNNRNHYPEKQKNDFKHLQDMVTECDLDELEQVYSAYLTKMMEETK